MNQQTRHRINLCQSNTFFILYFIRLYIIIISFNVKKKRAEILDRTYKINFKFMLIILLFLSINININKI